MYVPINNIFHATSKATPLENGIDLKISRIIPPKVNEMNKQKSIITNNFIVFFILSTSSVGEIILPYMKMCCKRGKRICRFGLYSKKTICRETGIGS